jgi:hypothetical protein
MSIPVSKYRALAEKLYTSTADESLRWQIDPFMDELYTSLSHYKIVLTSGEDAEGSPYVRVAIRNGSNEEVDWFTDNTIGNAIPSVDGVGSYWILLRDLNTMAYRNAKGADKALDDILGELNNDDVPF